MDGELEQEYTVAQIGREVDSCRCGRSGEIPLSEALPERPGSDRSP
jgi:hypothetical protein